MFSQEHLPVLAVAVVMSLALWWVYRDLQRIKERLDTSATAAAVAAAATTTQTETVVEPRSDAPQQQPQPSQQAAASPKGKTRA